ncbi:hypothetical protein SPRG_02617 [Saprolegnia parasitica CBS 223.65]|uniref:Uncharacterized protein n=1 Tax=Saprolegnia parasitica (strain CBS 223.65) TaxID=695850 RepID=A0A067CQE0_SAPPC|nr:hypothetical protein SPRG_02617 [Saprolegnia parasitica CBS 223.65]KDO32924.1 hypothetical protein SPRG_02617 [Saprolegnia parasitica CBS 223.65]|eukprot:XP_012196571.1 hypothetical protein SPRG_02617 [Saprolegnia parasitica CBS 223.65]
MEIRRSDKPRPALLHRHYRSGALLLPCPPLILVRHRVQAADDESSTTSGRTSCNAAESIAPLEKALSTLPATPSVRASPLPTIVLGLLVLYTLYCLRAVQNSLLQLHGRLDTLEETLVAQASATCPTELVHSVLRALEAVVRH